MTFLGTPPIVGTNADGNPITGNPPSATMPMSGRLGGTASGEVSNLGYTPIGINHIESENTPYTTSDGMSNKGTASSMFMHEVLDEFLNFNLKGNVNSSSPKIDKVKYQNAALKNLGLPQRDGQDHE
jgi:hypothetical protein